MDTPSVRETLAEELGYLSDTQIAALLEFIRAWRPIPIPTPEQVAQSKLYNKEWPVLDGDDLPTDLSVNLDHYLYGADKQEP